jgi:3-oxoacyl-[acyl-carrier-protein] synthase III
MQKTKTNLYKNARKKNLRIRTQKCASSSKRNNGQAGITDEDIDKIIMHQANAKWIMQWFLDFQIIR